MKNMENQNCKELLKSARLTELPSGVGEIISYFAEHIDNLDTNTIRLKRQIKEQNKTILQHTRGLQDIEEEYPLLPPEADDLSKAVKKKGVTVLGGKNSEAYKDTSLRKRIYQDIYLEIKRHFGLIDEKGAQQSYKKLKRKHLSAALLIIEEYEPPISLENEITMANDIDED